MDDRLAAANGGFPETASQAPVPPAYLWRLMFLRQEPSDLTLYNHGQRLGSLQIQPRLDQARPKDGGSPTRLLTMHGGFSIDAPWARRQNVVVHGLLELDGQNNARRLEITAAIHEPKQTTPGWALLLDGQPDVDHWHYVIREGDVAIGEKTGSFGELLDVPELRSLGIDLASLSRTRRQQAARMSITAHRDKLKVNGDETDIYVASFKDASGFEATLQMNQLGQILAVRTSGDFDLLDASLAP